MLWIITDSRGRGLDDWAPEGTKITMRPGATLDTIFLHIFDSLNSQHHHSLDILISAGINNITKKESNQLIFHPSFDSESFCHTINQFHASLIEHPSINSVAFTTIPSCSLIKYQHHQLTMHRLSSTSLLTDDYLTNQQDLINSSLSIINDFITDLNTTNHHPTVKLHKDLIRHTKRRRGQKIIKRPKLSFIHLFDGLHPDDHLKSIWFSLLINFKPYFDHVTRQDDMDDDDDDNNDDNSWDFKRR